jgi:phosphoheptose isomerase
MYSYVFARKDKEEYTKHQVFSSLSTSGNFRKIVKNKQSL